jgi:hypothetical protein
MIPSAGARNGPTQEAGTDYAGDGETPMVYDGTPAANHRLGVPAPRATARTAALAIGASGTTGSGVFRFGVFTLD